MGTWQDKRRKTWWYKFQKDGKEYSGGGTKTKGEARAKREEHRKRVKEEAQKTETGTVFSELVNQYLDWSQRRHVRRTYEFKRSIYRKFIDFCGDPEIQNITPHLVHSFLNSMPTNQRYNTYRKDLSALFCFGQKRLRVIQNNPCWLVDKLPVDKIEKQIPTREEFLRILAASNHEERPLLMVLCHTLARIDEILRLTWQDVNFEMKTVTLWTRKTRGGSWKSRLIPMNQDLSRLLMSLWRTRKQEKWVFYNEQSKDRYLRRPKLMRSICTRAGVKHYGFHTFRHFVSTYVHDILKVPTGVISGILGHESKRTTEIYLHSVEESARSAMKALEGIFEIENARR